MNVRIDQDSKKGKTPGGLAMAGNANPSGIIGIEDAWASLAGLPEPVIAGNFDLIEAFRSLSGDVQTYVI